MKNEKVEKAFLGFMLAGALIGLGIAMEKQAVQAQAEKPLPKPAQTVRYWKLTTINRPFESDIDVYKVQEGDNTCLYIAVRDTPNVRDLPVTLTSMRCAW